ncbi:MAG: cation transporter [Gammaproteobacteria bacterium]|nr:cation transporter [Gammaproteobacteria bacterium]
MNKIFFILLLAVAGTLLMPTATLAGELKTVTLSVDKMTCNLCPVTVKKALRKIDGVREVNAKYEGDGMGWATVTYDAAKVKTDDLTVATEQAGYPSRLKQ